MLAALALAAGAAIGIAVAHLPRIARPRPVPPVPERAMRRLLERDRPNAPDGTG